MNKFKVGDKVVNTFHWDDKFWPMGHKFIVTSIEQQYVKGLTANGCRGSIEQWCCELQEEPMSELEKLVEEANRGEQAIQKIMKEYPGQVTGYFSNLNGVVDKDWRMEYSYKIKSKPTFTPFFIKDGFREVKLNDKFYDIIEIGSAMFKLEDLALWLTSMCKEPNMCSVGNKLRASRRGINYEDGFLTWDEADQILAAIKAFKESE